MANEMLRKWSLDDQCQKSVVIVVATEDKRFWVARSPRVPVYAAEFNQIFADQVGGPFFAHLQRSIESIPVAYFLNLQMTKDDVEFVFTNLNRLNASKQQVFRYGFCYRVPFVE